MRKKIAFLLAVVLSLSLVACGTNNAADSSETDDPENSQIETPVAEERDCCGQAFL